MTTEELIKENEELRAFRRNIVAFHDYDMFRAFGNPMLYPPGHNGKKRTLATGGMELKILDNILKGKKPYQGTQRETVLKENLEAVNKSIERYASGKGKLSFNLKESIGYRDTLKKKLDALDYETLHADR